MTCIMTKHLSVNSYYNISYERYESAGSRSLRLYMIYQQVLAVTSAEPNGIYLLLVSFTEAILLISTDSSSNSVS
jgi:hypothetical protein